MNILQGMSGGFSPLDFLSWFFFTPCWLLNFDGEVNYDTCPFQPED